MSYASSLPGGANFDVNERDSLTYTAAERVYMRGNVAEAKNSFTSYLQSFPQGAFSVNASYYLGIIAYNEKDYSGATTYLNKVLEYPDSKFSTEAMTLCAQMAYNGKEYPRALELYKRLSDRAGNQEERLQAQTAHIWRTIPMKPLPPHRQCWPIASLLLNWKTRQDITGQRHLSRTDRAMKLLLT